MLLTVVTLRSLLPLNAPLAVWRTRTLISAYEEQTFVAVSEGLKTTVLKQMPFPLPGCESQSLLCTQNSPR
jgi:hypothetical protein